MKRLLVPVKNQWKVVMRTFRLVGGLAAFALMLVARPAFAQYSYEVTHQADYGPKYDTSLGGCYSGLSVVSCGQYVSFRQICMK